MSIFAESKTMPQEIERKFLVRSDEFKSLAKGEYIHQGFLSTVKERVVRVRIKGEEAWITVKGISKGASRAEFEYEIPFEDARFLLNHICEQPTISKHRYAVLFEGFTWEVDEFHGENEGLVVAEIELPAEDTPFDLPPWAGEEVTTDTRYFNASLVKNPYKNWKT
ncbi:MAG: CYTH domain-containing protein [Bacteroidales bacterium]|nr:CYTH domain-containing protein [Bacteroidales bacterium]